MFEIKPIAKEFIPRALEKAERYRLLNEPGEAESICLDILQIEPNHQQALMILLLARTDQFTTGMSVEHAREVLPRVTGEYERAYYAGLICERRAKALLEQASHGSRFVAYDWFRQAMSWYEKAEKLHPAGNEDAILRWNTCARILIRNPDLKPQPEDPFEPPLE
jgi:hypothetical protein